MNTLITSAVVFSLLSCLPAVTTFAGEATADEAVSAPPAEMPHWPVAFNFPETITKDWRRNNKPEAQVLVWTPPAAKRIRAAMLIPQNTDSKHVGEHDAVRRVAAKHEIGIIYLRHFDGSVVERTDPPEQAEKVFAALMELVAENTGIKEYRHAPWITFGKSSRGRFPFRTAWWFPQRVIASISYHGETPTWPMEKWSRVKDESIMHLALNGETEWDGTWYRHVRPCMLNYHLNTEWLTHQVVLPGVGHGNYADKHGSDGWNKPVPEGAISCLQAWDYIALFIDKAMTLRYPADEYATDGPVTLKQVDRATGYLLHPRAPEELIGIKWHAFRQDESGYKVIPWPEEPSPVIDTVQGTVDTCLLVRAVEDVPEEEQRHLFWVPDREMLRAWLALHDVNSKLDF